MIRLAVIGGGPKSLFALLALHDRLPWIASEQLTVDVFDPHLPGSGNVWRPNQPQVLRLNVDASIVDASSGLSAESFSIWAARTAPDRPGEKYPPRALVGRYLREQFQLLSRFGRFALSHVPSAVTGVAREGLQWRVSGPFGSGAYDEVLLATGHGLAEGVAWDPLPGAVNAHPLMGEYGSLTMETIPAASEVWVRGAALTAYDVALMLTEGRGGHWQSSGQGRRGWANMRYLPSGAEPRRITLASRGGTLMDPKNENVPAEVSACLKAHGTKLRQWGEQARQGEAGGDAGLAGMWAVLLRCAQDCARLMGVQVSALSLWRTALTGHSVVSGVDSATAHMPQTPVDAVSRLKSSVAMSHGMAPIATGWLWARVWSGLYAELVSAIDRLPRTTREQQQFLTVARNLERFAFGPPELTARKLVGLFDAGILHLAAAGQGPPPGTVVVDAVTPGPGALRAPAPQGQPVNELLAGLLHAGEISIRDGDRGLLTAPDGTCLARDGSRNESLAALGRLTEDPTLGHDTLNRSLHGEYGLWAQRLTGLLTDQRDPRT